MKKSAREVLNGLATAYRKYPMKEIEETNEVTQALLELQALVPQCKDCGYWKRCSNTDYHGDFHLGECVCDKFSQGYGINPEKVPKDGVLVENDEGWAFYTGEEFGCKHFQALADCREVFK